MPTSFRPLIILAIAGLSFAAHAESALMGASKADLLKVATSAPVSASLDRNTFSAEVREIHGQSFLMISSETKVAGDVEIMREILVPVKVNVQEKGGQNYMLVDVDGGSGSSRASLGEFRRYSGHTVAELLLPANGYVANAGLLAGGGRHSASNQAGISFGSGYVSFAPPSAGVQLGVKFELTQIQFVAGQSAVEKFTFNDLSPESEVREANTTVSTQSLLSKTLVKP